MKHMQIALKMIVMALIAATLTACAGSNLSSSNGTRGSNLLNDDLTNCILKKGTWTIEKGVLSRHGGGGLWTNEQYGDFILDLDFKLAKGTNSGVFIRTGNIQDPVQTGIEIQIYDTYGKKILGKHDCGAVYDCMAPSQHALKPPGQWNHLTIKANDNKLNITMNGKKIINMDINRWTEVHKNPDGTKNKYNKAVKDFPRSGHIGFQDHGKPVWYRNILITPI